MWVGREGGREFKYLLLPTAGPAGAALRKHPQEAKVLRFIGQVHLFPVVARVGVFRELPEVVGFEVGHGGPLVERWVGIKALVAVFYRLGDSLWAGRIPVNNVEMGRN